MPDLNISNVPKSHPSVRWVYVTSAFTIALFALFRMLPPDLLTLPKPTSLRYMIPDISSNSEPNLTAKQILFTDFGAIRRVVSEIILMASSPNSMERKTDFLDMSNNFLRERMQRLFQTSKKLQKNLGNRNLINVENSFDALKRSLKTSSNKDNQLFKKSLENFLMEIGIWLRTVAKAYESVMKRATEECSWRIKTLEEKISRQIYETQHGKLCEQNRTVFQFSDIGKTAPKFHNLGMGSLLHRIETCMAVAVQSGSPCLIDDYHFEYDPGNLSKYYSDAKVCSSAENRTNKMKLNSLAVPGKYADYIINVPIEVKTKLEFCHEDPAAWYRGVILKHMLTPSRFSEDSMAKMLRESKVTDLNGDITQITAVHIRSRDVGRPVEFLQPREYFIALKYLCIVKKHLCKSKTTWVATDNHKHWISFDSEIEKDDNSMKEFKTFGLNVSDVTTQATRYNPHSLMQFFTDLRVLSTAKATVGALSSNLLLYAYAVRCVDDPAASDRTLSLDFMYYPIIRKRHINFFLISPNFLFKTPPKQSGTITKMWPQQLTINDGRVLINFVRAVMDKPMRKPPLREGGFLKVLFVNGTVFASPFYTPYFNLRRAIETV